MYTLLHKPQLLIPDSTAAVFIRVGDREEYIIFASFKYVEIEEDRVLLSNGYISLEPVRYVNVDSELQYLLELEGELLPCTFQSVTLTKEGDKLLADDMQLTLLTSYTLD